MSKKMKSIILSLTLFVAVLFTSVANAEFLTLNQIGEASCRVRVSSSAGSGTSIAEDENSIYVLTNAHVVGSNKGATCEFFRYGRKTSRIPGEVVWKSYSDRTVNDFAIIRLPKAAFGDYPPRIVPFAPIDHQIHKNDYIASAGCPAARWLQLWEGHALSSATSNRVLFTPPPLGGQSGSGIYTVIDGDTYLCAVLTWKVEGNKGGAIHIGNFLKVYNGKTSVDELMEKVPLDWEYVDYEIPVRKAYYALGDNGLYYMQGFSSQGWEQTVQLPKGHEHIEIVQWNVILEVSCPGGRCPPIIKPPSPDTSPTPNPDSGGGNGVNPYGTLPPNLGGERFDGDKSDEYKKKIEDLEEKIGALTEEKNTLSKNLDGLNSSLSQKTQTLDALKKELEIAKKSTTNRTKEVESLSGRILDLNHQIIQQITNIVALEDELITKDSELGNLEGQYSDLKGKATQVKSQRNLFAWLFGGTTTGTLIWIASFYWKLRGKRKVKNIIDEKLDPEEITEDIGNRIDDVQDSKEADLRGLADYLQDKFENLIENKLDSLQGKLCDRIDKLEEATTQDINIYNNIDDNDTIKVVPTNPAPQEEIPVLRTPKQQRQQGSVATEGDPEVDCDKTILEYIRTPEFPPATSRIKDFIELKRSDGEKIEELAFYAHLYKEAVELLKLNRLIVKKGAQAYKVNSQIKAGEAIDKQVQDQFLKRVSSATISSHILYHEAMIGFLYRQAVGKLKRGEFNVLGYKEVAESVEKWVKVEFLKRMGFDF